MSAHRCFHSSVSTPKRLKALYVEVRRSFAGPQGSKAGIHFPSLGITHDKIDWRYTTNVQGTYFPSLNSIQIKYSWELVVVYIEEVRCWNVESSPVKKAKSLNWPQPIGLSLFNPTNYELRFVNFVICPLLCITCHAISMPVRNFTIKKRKL